MSEPGGQGSPVIAAGSGDLVQANAGTLANTQIAGLGQTASADQWQPALENVRGENIKGTWVTFMQLRMIATTRRGRISDWALGAFIAALPGTIQSLKDMYETTRLPAVGHQVEIAIAFVAFGVMFRSLTQFAEPTSRDLLDQISPKAGHGLGYFATLGRLFRRWRADFKGAGP